MFRVYVFQIAYKANYKHDIVDYNYPATLTPSYQTTVKLVPLKDVSSLPIACSSSLLSCGVILRQQDGKKQDTTVHSRWKGLRKGHYFPLGSLFVYVWKLSDYHCKVGTTLVSSWKWSKVQFLLLESSGLCPLLGLVK